MRLLRTSMPSTIEYRSGALLWMTLPHMIAMWIEPDEPSRGDSETQEMAYDGDMVDNTDPADALKGLRQLLHRFESRQMSVKQGGTDATTREIAVLRREIEQLERTLSRLSR
jgi:hypothetical protein